MTSEITEQGLRQLRDQINEILGEREAWPYRRYCVPPKNAELGDKYEHRTLYKNPGEDDAMFYMPPAEHDFPCHDCDGQYGPWVHAGFSINVDGGYGSKPIYANILHVRYRWCRDCGRLFHNSYAVGQVHFERNERGSVSFKEFENE